MKKLFWIKLCTYVQMNPKIYNFSEKKKLFIYYVDYLFVNNLLYLK